MEVCCSEVVPVVESMSRTAKHNDVGCLEDVVNSRTWERVAQEGHSNGLASNPVLDSTRKQDLQTI